MPEISVIVPVYNVEPYLHRCIDSILAQSFTDFELILVDDGSPDNCGAICDEYAAKDKRIHVIHQDNQGQGAARNHALDWMFANSDSEYVSFIDSDDWVHPRYLEALYCAVHQFAVRISACRLQLFRNLDEIQAEEDINTPVVVDSAYIYTHGEKRIYTYVCGLLYDRSLWKTIRFPEEKKWEDLRVFHIVLLQERHAAWIDQYLYYYFRNPNGTVYSRWSPEKMDYVSALEELMDDPAIMEEESILQAIKDRYVHYLNSIINELTDSKDSEIDRKKYIKELQKKLHSFLKSPKNDCYRFRSHKYLFAAANPVLFNINRKLYWCYWTIIGVSRKVRRLLTKHA